MLSEADERRAFERLERAWCIGDVEAQLIVLQDLARYWWRLAELKRISDLINNSATDGEGVERPESQIVLFFQ